MGVGKTQLAVHVLCLNGGAVILNEKTRIPSSPSSPFVSHSAWRCGGVSLNAEVAGLGGGAPEARAEAPGAAPGLSGYQSATSKVGGKAAWRLGAPRRKRGLAAPRANGSGGASLGRCSGRGVRRAAPGRERNLRNVGARLWPENGGKKEKEKEEGGGKGGGETKERGGGGQGLRRAAPVDLRKFSTNAASARAAQAQPASARLRPTWRWFTRRPLPSPRADLGVERGSWGWGGGRGEGAGKGSGKGRRGSRGDEEVRRRQLVPGPRLPGVWGSSRGPSNAPCSPAWAGWEAGGFAPATLACVVENLESPTASGLIPGHLEAPRSFRERAGRCRDALLGRVQGGKRARPVGSCPRLCTWLLTWRTVAVESLRPREGRGGAVAAHYLCPGSPEGSRSYRIKPPDPRENPWSFGERGIWRAVGSVWFPIKT